MNNTTLKSTILGAAALIFLAGPVAHAASPDSKLVMDGRADYVSQMFNDDATAPGGARPNNSGFKLNNIRADFQGRLGEETTYRMRLNFGNTSAANNAADGLSSFLDYAYVSRTLMPGLNLLMGKQWNGTAGIVGAYDPSDFYLIPRAYLDEYLAGLIYNTGVGLNYSVAGQWFALTVTDPGAGSSDPATGQPNNSRQVISGRWFGDFLDHSLIPTLGYISENRQNQTAGTKDLKNTYLSAGFKYTIPMLDVEFDYLANAYADKTTAGSNDSTTTAYLLARYKMDGLKPFAAYEMSTVLTETSATTEKKATINNFQLGVEYYPKKSEDFRYHVVYTNGVTATDAGTGTTVNQKAQQIIVGMRFKSDFMK